MAGEIYKKPVAFSVLAAVVILAGSIVTMGYPMLRADMHPRLEKLRPFTPLELAGRDLYQREGCVNCHTQTVRPLKSEVLRYGEYSKAGEFAYDRPFLWGSKRTGPDLAREGGKRPDGWHVKHFENPQAFEPRSNMPRYAFLASARLDPAEVKAHYLALAGLHAEMKAGEADFAALAQRTEMDAMVAYMQWLGHAVARRAAGPAVDLAAKNPFGNDPGAIARGHKVFADNCAVCHGDEGHGQEGVAPDLLDDVFLGEKGDMPDGAWFALISGGSDAKGAIGRQGDPGGGMTAFAGQLSADDIWAAISWARAQRAHERGETPAVEKMEHAPAKQPERHQEVKP
jgi:cytochrome c oxidase cbb3-type subunit 2